jgi:hypothetical protein
MPLLWMSVAFLAGIILADLVVQPTLVWISLGVATLLIWVVISNLGHLPGFRQFMNRFVQGELLTRFREITRKAPLPISILLIAVFAGATRFQVHSPRSQPIPSPGSTTQGRAIILRG